MEKIRVAKAIKRIEVNDAGEYIEFNIADPEWMEGYVELSEFFDSKKAVINELQTISQKDEDDISNLKKLAQERLDMCKTIASKIDKLFGDKASIKIFGTNIPDEFAIYDFFDQIVPYIEQAKNERKNLIDSKYNNSRKGAN